MASLGSAQQVWHLPSRLVAVPGPRALGSARLEGWFVAISWAPSSLAPLASLVSEKCGDFPKNAEALNEALGQLCPLENKD